MLAGGIPLRLTPDNCTQILTVYTIPTPLKSHFFNPVQGISDAYRHIIRGYLVHFHANIMRHSTRRFNYRGGSIGNFFFAGTRIFFRCRPLQALHSVLPWPLPVRPFLRGQCTAQHSSLCQQFQHACVPACPPAAGLWKPPSFSSLASLAFQKAPWCSQPSAQVHGLCCLIGRHAWARRLAAGAGWRLPGTVGPAGPALEDQLFAGRQV